jgi:hypothetical protein
VIVRNNTAPGTPMANSQGDGAEGLPPVEEAESAAGAAAAGPVTDRRTDTAGACHAVAGLSGWRAQRPSGGERPAAAAGPFWGVLDVGADARKQGRWPKRLHGIGTESACKDGKRRKSWGVSPASPFSTTDAIPLLLCGLR